MISSTDYLDPIIDVLNRCVGDAFGCERMKLLGLAKPVRVDTSNPLKPKIVPGIYQNGKYDTVYSGFDDKYGLMAYHRQLNMTARRKAGSGYGDSLDSTILTHNMVMVLTGDTDILKMDESQMAMTVQYAFPDSVIRARQEGTWVYDTIFNVNSINLLAEQVFREEYHNTDYFLGPQHALLKVAYVIESTINTKCLKRGSVDIQAECA